MEQSTEDTTIRIELKPTDEVKYKLEELSVYSIVWISIMGKNRGGLKKQTRYSWEPYRLINMEKEKDSCEQIHLGAHFFPLK